MPERNTLHTCHLGDKAAFIHPCGKAAKALSKHGHDFDQNVFDQGKPLGRGTEGTRPELKEMSGQEKLPVLEMTDGSAISGSKNIVDWAKENARA